MVIYTTQQSYDYLRNYAIDSFILEIEFSELLKKIMNC